MKNNRVSLGTTLSDNVGVVKEARNVSGIVIAFDNIGERGLVLLQHYQDESLEAVLKRYKQGRRSSRPCWTARFAWNALDKETRSRCLGRNRGAKRKQRKKISDLLVGRVVRCRVQKTKKWEAVDVIMEADAKKYYVTNQWKKSGGSGRKPLSPGQQQAELKDYWKNVKRPSNVDKPWRG